MLHLIPFCRCAWSTATQNSTTQRPELSFSCRFIFTLFIVFFPCNQETCNLLIEGARRFLDPSSIFQIEVILLNRQQLTHVFNQVEEGLDKVKISIRNLKEFKTCFQVDFQWSLIYDLYCSGVQDCPAIILHRPRQACTLLGVSGNLSKTLSKSNFPQEPLVFKRYDSFLDRLGTMMEFFSTAVQVDSAFISQTNFFQSFLNWRKLRLEESGAKH